MKRICQIVICILSLILLFTGCKKDNSIETVDLGDSRFLMVTLEGTDAQSATVSATRYQQNESKEWVETEVIPLSPGDNNVHCALLEQGGCYGVQVTCGDGSIITQLVSLDNSQVCSLHICVDPKPAAPTRTLWPRTPHNTPDAQ